MRSYQGNIFGDDYLAKDQIAPLSKCSPEFVSTVKPEKISVDFSQYTTKDATNIVIYKDYYVFAQNTTINGSDYVASIVLINIYDYSVHIINAFDIIETEYNYINITDFFIFKDKLYMTVSLLSGCSMYEIDVTDECNIIINKTIKFEIEGIDKIYEFNCILVNDNHIIFYGYAINNLAEDVDITFSIDESYNISKLSSNLSSLYGDYSRYKVNGYFFVIEVNSNDKKEVYRSVDGITWELFYTSTYNNRHYNQDVLTAAAYSEKYDLYIIYGYRCIEFVTPNGEVKFYKAGYMHNLIKLADDAVCYINNGGSSDDTKHLAILKFTDQGIIEDLSYYTYNDSNIPANSFAYQQRALYDVINNNLLTIDITGYGKDYPVNSIYYIGASAPQLQENEYIKFK